MVVSTWSSQQAAKLIGLTYRQLDHWCTKGIVTSVREAKGSGTQRRFHYRDLVRLRIAKSMRDAGVSLERIGKAFELAEELINDDDITAFIIICGDDIAFVDRQRLMSLLEAPGQGMLNVLKVAHEVRELDASIASAHPDAHVNPDGVDQQLLALDGASATGEVFRADEAGQLALL